MTVRVQRRIDHKMSKGRPADFEHVGLIYEDEREYLSATRDFIEDGLESGEPALVPVPDKKVPKMRAALGVAAASVEFWNMSELGRNPGRIIPAVRGWVDHQASSASRCRFIGEPIWAGRSPSEIVEATRHEALINVAFAGCPATILCPYDAVRLDAPVLSDMERTHPMLVHDGTECASAAYADPLDVWRDQQWPLADPHAPMASLSSSRDLPGVRRFAAAHLERVGLSPTRRQDLVLAVDEAATNAIVHGGGAADVRIWREGSRVVCEVADCGTFDAPLAGRQRPGLDWMSGRGVWLMNELCDLVELRPIDDGTVARMHVELDAAAAQPIA